MSNRTYGRSRITRAQFVTPLFGGPLKNSLSDRLFKNDAMQGARILRNEAYIHLVRRNDEG